MRVSTLRLKALALLLGMALLPLAGALYWFLPGHYDVVGDNARQIQLAAAAQATLEVERHITSSRSDAQAVALALSYASSDPGAGLTSVKAVLASRPDIDAVRFEVPQAKVSTVISIAGADRAAVAESTPELRAEADRSGMALSLGSRAFIVVPIPKPAGAQGEPPKGYVTAPIYLKPIEEDLVGLAETRFRDKKPTLLVVDAQRSLVVSYNLPKLAGGDATKDLAIWEVLPEGNPRALSMAVQSEFTHEGERMLGTIQPVEQLGWATVLWQPEREAMAAFYRIRSLLGWVAGGVALLALIAGFVAARTITRPVLDMVAQTRKIGQRAWSQLRPASKRRDELGELSSAIVKMAEDLQEGEQELERQIRMRGDLSRFMSKELVDGILAGEHPLALGGKRMNVTVLFADVVAFTPLAEGRAPEQVVALLNELFTVLTEVVFRHGGVVDKFIGDCLMAVWGVPVETEDHAVRALAAAEDMMRFLEVGADGWRDKYGAEVRLAIGVNSGEAIVGNVGSDKRMEYTVIGDIVNVAARLEAIAAPDQVLVGERTYEAAKDEVELRLLGARKLTGRKAETNVYELETA